MRKRILWIAVISSLMLGLLTGCGASVNVQNQENSETALVVVVGKHANSVEIPLNAPTLKEALYKTCYGYGSVSFVLLDGNPNVYFQADIPKPEVGGLTESKKKSIATSYTQQLLQAIQQANPKVAEVDTLKAIRKAAMTLQGSSDSAEKVMMIMDSGLSTLGYLDFTKGLLNADVEHIVEAIKEAEAIPDVEGVRVIWMFLGQTASPQQELSEKQKNKLQNIWKEILLAGGASEVHFASDIASETVNENNFPHVSLVDVDSRNIDVMIEEPMETIVLDNTSVQFVGDKAEFVDEALAMSHISKLAEQLLRHPNNKVYVIGTTASGRKDFCNQLSLDRATTVVQALIGMGVPKSQLIPIGLGFEDPWHIPDLDENGKKIKDKAALNRKVLVVDVNGSDAKKLNKEM